VTTETTDRITVRGIDVTYRRAGEGEPILYLHGIGTTHRWLPLHEHVAQTGDLVAPEHPGFAETPLPDWFDGFDDLVLHYAELADVLELGRFHLVGHSFGGWIAAELAAFYPERLRSLTLIAPLGLRVPGHTPTDLFRLNPERFAELYLGGEDDTDDAEAMFARYAEMTAFAKVAWNPRYDHKLDRRLGRVTCPALVVAGEEDRILPRAHAERYGQLLSGRIVTVPGGHAAVTQEPAAVAAAIADLVGGR
jgi:pimeloyl-ACP methyl ester carboxylesterase